MDRATDPADVAELESALSPPPAAPVRRRRRPDLQPPEGPTPFARRMQLNPHILWAGSIEDLLAIKKYFVGMDRFDLDRGWRENRSRLYVFRPPEPVRQSGRIQFWTLDGLYPEDDRTEAEELVRLWLSVARAELPHRIDVLATPRMGGEVLYGLRWVRRSVAGAYFPRDRFIVLRTRGPPRRVARTLKHELAHAVPFYLNDEFTVSRLVGEGLATYLSLGKRGDSTVGEPLDRMGPLLALLDRYLTFCEAHGIRPRSNQLSRWVDAPPSAFYYYGRFGYLLGTAAIAHVGVLEIERALAERSGSRLEAAIRRISWAKFREWVRRGGAGADPGEALVVQDGDVGQPPPVLLREWEAKLGMPRRLVKVPDLLPAKALLAEFLEPSDRPILFLADLSSRMDVDRGGWTGREWARRLHGMLREAAPVDAHGLSDPPEAVGGGLRDVRLWSDEGLRLLHDERYHRIVVCTAEGSPEVAKSGRRFNWGRPVRVLVVDLGAEPSALAALLTWGSKTAYMRPDALPKDD